jgi:hypothetical protein
LRSARFVKDRKCDEFDRGRWREMEKDEEVGDAKLEELFRL